MNKEITIIGAGNMGQAVAGGLLEQKVVAPKNLVLSNPRLDKLKSFADSGVTLESNNKMATLGSEILILSVKPQIMSSVLQEIKGAVDPNQLVISLAAGISLSSLRRGLTETQPVVRVMPNLPAQIGQSMSVWAKNENVTSTQEQKVKTILGVIGMELQVSSDDQIDKATAISGSGPAYVAYFWELMIDSAINLGFSEQDAQRLVKQTILGTIQLIENSDISPRNLREQVTSRGGTTEAALREFQRRGLRGNFRRGISSAYKRALELGRSFSIESH